MKAVQEFAESMPVLFTALKIILILIVTRLLVALLMRILKQVEEGRNKLGKSTNSIGYRLLKNALRTALYILGAITAVKQVPALSTAVTAILAGSGILAVAIGFAAQESCGNLVSGLLLSIFRPFNVGDWVLIHSQDIEGCIEDITLRHTVIRTILRTRMIVPNSLMGSAVVENTHFRTEEPIRRYVEVDISYDSDIAAAKRIMEQVMTSHPLYAGDTPPIVYVRGFGSSGVSLRASMATKTMEESFIACSEVRQRLKEAFDANGITIPFTTVTISNLRELVRDK